MLPPYKTLVKIHRFLVKCILFFGLLQVITGIALLENFGPNYLLLIHRQTALIFALVFLSMLTTGTLRYFHSWLSRLKIFSKNMTGHFLKLVKKETIAQGTMSYSFAKPQGFSFVAGQHLEWEEIDPPETDAEGKSRAFTISAA